MVEAAHRLGVHETQVRSVEECPAGHRVLLRSGVLMLVSETTARVFVPEVDEPAAGVDSGGFYIVGEDAPPPAVSGRPKVQRKGKAGGSGG